MNILFISRLYPAQKGNFEITRALHDIVRYWCGAEKEKVVVIRPVYIYLGEILSKWKTILLKKKIITIDNVTVIVFPVYKIPRLSYFFRPLYRFLDKYLKSTGFNVDIVVAHYDKSLNIGLRYSQMRNLPFAAGFHVTPDLMSENPIDFTKRCDKVVKRAAVIACRSRYIYEKITKWFPERKKKCFIAYSGIDDRLIIEKTAGISRLKQWKRGGQVSIICVAGIKKVKNVDTVLMALARLKETIDWTFTVIGDGVEREKLEALTQSLGIADQVRFMGRRSPLEVCEEMRQSHIFVMVSCMESFGLVYLEAMAAGNIVIGSVGEGIDGVIEDRKSGFLVPAGEVEPLRKKLETIILHMPEQELENVLKNAHNTIKKYTEKSAALNYLKRLKENN
ncbi:MAG: glycosyltransferase family 4 protein [bacterium]|nr:glycosyltransferase family 4 protein [bacterium]